VPQETARRAMSSSWFEPMLRVGHVAKGAVFGAIGFLAARLALGDRDETPDFAGALEALSEQPLNALILIVLALGLFAYAGWRFVYAVAGPAGESRLGRLTARSIMLGVGLTYAGFGTYAVALLLGLRRQDDGVQDETAMVLTLPFGRWIVMAVAAGVVIAGLHELFVAFTGRFREEFRNTRLRPWERWLVLGTGWSGHAARGAIYCAVGFYGIKAGVTYDPEEARGFADTLWEIATGPMGTGLLLLIAVGLISFGAYSLLLGLHRHVPEADGGAAEERGP
jgi:hypothetical protein